jgi:ribosomal protein S27E
MKKAQDQNSHNPLRIYCKNCGAPVAFDIVHQTYRCSYCGTDNSIEEVRKEQQTWRQLHQEHLEEPEVPRISCHCPSCGAEVLFPAGEAAAHCEFCGSELVRNELQEQAQMPDFIIPFFIKEDEARQRLMAWAKQNERLPEAKAVLSNIKLFRGYYLPYRLVRGPVAADVSRENCGRVYHCAGCLDGTLVNTTQQLDNLVLDKMEPFDWEQAVPFHWGYVGGQRVKMNDLSEKSIGARIADEAGEDFRPALEKTMQTSGIVVTPSSFGLETMDVLLPVYFVRKGNLTAVMNGQTGRIAVSTGRQQKSNRWIFVALLRTVIFTLLFTGAVVLISGSDEPDALITAGLVGIFIIGVICFIIGSRNKGGVKDIIVTTETAQASREQGKLQVKEQDVKLQKAAASAPVFYEENEKGNIVPVHIRFYPPGRVAFLAFQFLGISFLPLILAALIRLLSMDGEPFMAGFAPKYGAAWFVMMLLVLPILWSQNARSDIFDFPYLYEIRPDGSERLMGSAFSRTFCILRLKTFDGSSVSIFDELIHNDNDMRRMILLLLGIMAFILLGSTLAIVF